tara:strand:- start:175 stop:480 length:306 start_codon:yes stop_codon:yes gene_type:complete
MKKTKKPYQPPELGAAQKRLIEIVALRGMGTEEVAHAVTAWAARHEHGDYMSPATGASYFHWLGASKRPMSRAYILMTADALGVGGEDVFMAIRSGYKANG